MRLPDTIRVQLHAAGATVRLDQLLIGLDIQYQGRYYYGSLLGLTDATGLLEAPGQLVAKQFVADRKLFLMDYKVPLEDCDAGVVVRLPGGATFVQRQREAATAPFITAQAQTWWGVARNRAIAPAEDWANLDGEAVVEVSLAAAPANGVEYTA